MSYMRQATVRHGELLPQDMGAYMEQEREACRQGECWYGCSEQERRECLDERATYEEEA